MEEFPCKNKLCVFCGCGIIHYKIESDLPPFSEHKFLQGISLFCELLKLTGKDELREWGSSPRWELVGVDNFAKLVCCPECFERLDKLINLHQLLVTTQATLNETLARIQECLQESLKSEVEYSIGACVQFREAILPALSRNLRVKSNEGTVTSTTKRRPRSSNSRAGKIPCSDHRDHTEISSLIPLHHRNPVVLVERLQLPVTPPPPALKQESVLPLSNNEEDHFDDVPSLSPPHSPVPPSPSSMASESERTNGIADEDEDYQPPVAKRPRPRGSSSKASSRSKIPRRKKRSPQTQPDADYLPEDKKAKPKGARKKRVQVVKTWAKVGSRRFFKPLADGPEDIRPIFAVDPSNNLLMFHNVPIRQTVSGLECLHPNCSFVQPLSGYFTHQFPLRNIRAHVTYHHRNRRQAAINNTSMLYYCHLCDIHLESKLLLALHRQEHHPQLVMPPALCEVCVGTFPQTDLIPHYFSHKSAEEKAAATQKAATPSRRGRRRKNLDTPLVASCDECPKVFKNHKDLLVHKQSHIPLELRRKFICELCGIKLCSDGNLVMHMQRVHFKTLSTSLKPHWQCPYCPRGYPKRFKEKYEDHVRSHTGERPFQCAQCGKNFASKHTLNTHERLHETLVNRLTCEYCPVTFTCRSNLRHHQINKHLDLLPNKPNPTTVGVHKKENFIGPTQMFPCEPCGHVFKRRGELRRHVQRMHLVIYPNEEDYPVMWTMEQHIESGATTKRAPVLNRKFKKKSEANHDEDGNESSNL